MTSVKYNFVGDSKAEVDKNTFPNYIFKSKIVTQSVQKNSVSIWTKSLLQGLEKSWIQPAFHIPLCVLTSTVKQTASVCNISSAGLASTSLCMQKTCCPGIETLPGRHTFAYLTVIWVKLDPVKKVTSK